MLKKKNLLFSLIVLVLATAMMLNAAVVAAQDPAQEPSEPAQEPTTEPAEEPATPAPAEDTATPTPTEDTTAPPPAEDTATPTPEEPATEPEEPAAPTPEEPAAPTPEEPATEPEEPAAPEQIHEPSAPEPIQEPTAEPTAVPAVELTSEDVSATTLPGSGWWTSAGLQNLENAQADVALTAYEQQGGGATTYSKSFFIPNNGLVTFLPNSGDDDGSDGTVQTSPNLPSGFAGSMVVQSSRQLVAIGQVGNNQLSLPGGALGVSGGQASALYRGASQGSSSIFYPTVKSNFGGKTTTMYVQATGANVTINATITTNDGVNHTFSGAVDANKTRVLSPSDFSPAIATTNCGLANTSPCVGAITIGSTGGDIVGTVIEAPSSGTAVEAQAASFFTSNDADTTLYCPVYKNNFGGRFTGITVQNVSGGTLTGNGVSFAASIVIGGSGTTTSNSGALNAGASTTFTAQIPNDGGTPNNSYATVKLTASGNIVAAVNESNFDGTKKKSTTYTCFAANNATSTVALPQVKELFGINTTGVSVLSTAGDATVSAVYKCNDGVTYTHVGVTLNASNGFGYTYFKPSSNAGNWSGGALTSNKNCAVTLTSGGAGIVAVAQESAPSAALDTKNYEGFNLP